MRVLARFKKLVLLAWLVTRNAFPSLYFHRPVAALPPSLSLYLRLLLINRDSCWCRCTDETKHCSKKGFFLRSFRSSFRRWRFYFIWKKYEREIYIFTFVSFFLSLSSVLLSSISIEFERWFEREEGEGIGAVGVRLSIGGRCIGENEKKEEREKKKEERRKEKKKKK